MKNQLLSCTPYPCHNCGSNIFTYNLRHHPIVVAPKKMQINDISDCEVWFRLKCVVCGCASPGGYYKPPENIELTLSIKK